MEKHNPLLPFAYSQNAESTSSEVQLNTTPRSRATIDENARSIYHDRVPPEQGSFNRPTLNQRPTLNFAPTLKRRMGESFNEKDDVKRRVTAFDDPESEEPTMVDSTSTDFDYDEYNDKPMLLHNKAQVMGIPSSPPLAPNLSSDFDASHKYSIPFSPSQKENLDPPSEFSPTKLKYVNKSSSIMQHKLGSEPDFGIDKFNRFRPSANQCPSTDRDITTSMEEHEDRQSMINLKARDIVINAFEEMRTTIDLEGIGLTEVPHEIKDLNNLVVFGGDSTQTVFQLYLTNNRIRVLSPALFKFTRLNVLALRQNKIEKIPALIANLTNLTDLSLGTNRLRFLPHQILDLPHLASFRAGPNPYLKVPEDAMVASTATLNPAKTIKYVGKIKYLKEDYKLVRSLKSFCLSEIATYDVSYQETKEWKRNTPRIYHDLIIYAIAQGNYKETCAECNCILVDTFAEVIEWWDMLQNQNIPFKKEFCSGACAKKYENRMMNDITYDE